MRNPEPQPRTTDPDDFADVMQSGDLEPGEEMDFGKLDPDGAGSLSQGTPSRPVLV